MKKTLTAFVAASMLATVPLAASTQDAAAWHKGLKHGIATGVGVGLGLGLAGALLQPRQRTVVVQQPAPVYVAPAPAPVPVYGGGFSQAHYQYCFSRYRSYDAPSNSYQPYSGPRRPCYSPY